CSLISRRTTGESSCPPVDPLPFDAGAGAAAAAGAGASSAGAAGGGGGGGGGGAAAAGAGAGAACAAGSLAAGAAGAGAAPASPTRASTVPTSTVSPSGTRISVIVPAIGDGTSESTLSVDTSNNVSSSATASPTFLNQRVIVPLVTVSPSWGIVMSAIAPLLSLAVEAAAGQRHDGLAEQ